jgi:hypothetical protein
VRIYEFEPAESKNYTRRRRCNGRECDGQRRQLWGQCSQWLEGSMEWSSVTLWLRSGVEERSHSNSVEWSGVVSGRSMELHGAPRGMSPNLIRHSYIPFWKAVSFCQIVSQSQILPLSPSKFLPLRPCQLNPQFRTGYPMHVLPLS